MVGNISSFSVIADTSCIKPKVLVSRPLSVQRHVEIKPHIA